MGWQLIFKGWAANSKTGLPAERVDVFLNGDKLTQIVPTVARPELAKPLGLDTVGKIGFLGRIGLPIDLTPGLHTIRLVIADGDTATLALPDLDITVLPPLPTAAKPLPTLVPVKTVAPQLTPVAKEPVPGEKPTDVEPTKPEATAKPTLAVKPEQPAGTVVIVPTELPKATPKP